MSSRVRRARKTARRLSRRRRIKVSLALFTLLSLGGLAATAGLVVAVARELPPLPPDPNPKHALTTKIYAADGTLLTDFFVDEDRIVVPLDQVSDHLRNAVVAIEDERFYQHQGVDMEAIARAFFTNVESGGVAEGGSTITQQYIKNIFVGDEQSFSRKIREAYLAYQLEQQYEKDKILENYLNTIYFGHSAYGIEAASRKYFNKNADELALEEAALLAGVIKSPNRYSPFTDLDRAKTRRNRVLERLADQGYITKKQLAAALARPINLNPKGNRVLPAPYFVEHVKQLLIAEFGATTVFKGGLRVHTAIDLDLQRNAEAAVANVLNRPGDPSAALVAVEPKTGYIRALVGGRDFSQQKFNLAVQGHRQPGSAFKTFVLVAAIEKGISPSRKYDSNPLVIDLPNQPWKVDNYSGRGGPPLTIRQAMARSVNAVFARLMMDVGAKDVAGVAGRMGIQTRIESYPAIALGGLHIGVTPMEMASAYGTLANGGIWAPPVAILKITDANGKIIRQAKVKTEEAIAPTTAYLTTDILKDVIAKGTGRRAALGHPAAGKTGTTQSYRDAWFVGFTPDLSVSVWVGHPEAQIPMTNVHGIRVSGGSFPAEIWGRFMRASTAKKKSTDFALPKSGVTKVRMCAMPGMEHLKATRLCPIDVTYEGAFLSDSVPKESCPVHAPDMATVPDLVGSDSAAGGRKLADAGLEMKILYVVGSPGGFIVAQTPKPKTRVEKGAVVTITIAAEDTTPDSGN